MAYSPEGARSNEHRNPPQVSAVGPADDVRTIMLNQVSWGAVFAGATLLGNDWIKTVIRLSLVPTCPAATWRIMDRHHLPRHKVV
jgi:hypothetical protein